VRILLVDDHEVVRIGLRALLSRHEGFAVVGEAASAAEAVEKAVALKPDIVVMDIRLPGRNGIEACRDIIARLPDTHVIMLTSYAEDELLFEAIRAGAAGYVLKQIGSDALVRAIEAVGRGEALLDPSLMRKVLNKLRQAGEREDENAFAGLSDQEVRILALIAEGHTNREIAEALFLSEKTVRNYVSAILGKLHVNHRAQAAAYAVAHRIKDHLPR